LLSPSLNKRGTSLKVAEQVAEEVAEEVDLGTTTIIRDTRRRSSGLPGGTILTGAGEMREMKEGTTTAEEEEDTPVDTVDMAAMAMAMDTHKPMVMVHHSRGARETPRGETTGNATITITATKRTTIMAVVQDTWSGRTGTSKLLSGLSPKPHTCTVYGMKAGLDE
jgi:hypothetical protein